MKVFKYSFDVADRVVLDMPYGAEVLCVQTQDNRPNIWAKVSPNLVKEKRVFRIFGTGHPISDDAKLTYVGTFQLVGGTFVGHLFEEVNHG